MPVVKSMNQGAFRKNEIKDFKLSMCFHFFLFKKLIIFRTFEIRFPSFTVDELNTSIEVVNSVQV